MSRNNTDRFESDDDISGVRKGKRGFPGWMTVLLCAVPIIAVVAIGGTFVYYSQKTPEIRTVDARAKQMERQSPAWFVAGLDSSAKRTYTRDEFKELVMGKTLEELTAVLGEPDASANGDLGLTYQYRNRTKNPDTGETDPVVEVAMKNGRVFQLTY